jgi:hypothetical protein
VRHKVRAANKSIKIPSGKTRQDTAMDQMISDLAEFEEFRTQIINSVRRDLLAGMPSDQLRKKYMPLITARMISEALTTPDAAKAASIAKDLTDRSEGKPTERKEITVKYADLPDEELDALLESEEAELKDIATRGIEQ